MKILLLSHRFSPDMGGIEVNSELLARGFCAEGHVVVVATWSASMDQSTSFPFPVERNPSVAKLLQLHRWADVVFENNPCLRLSWPVLLTRKPLIVAVRTWIARLNGSRNLADYFKLMWLHMANEVVAISEAVRYCSISSAHVIGNPFRDDLFSLDDTVRRERSWVYMGRLVSDKGVDLLLDALSSVFHILKEPVRCELLNLTIIGDGPERKKLEARVATLGLQALVTFTGQLTGSALLRTLQQHRFLAVPSLWEEPFGNVALEGMACGCVPLVSHGGGLPDAIGDAGLTFVRGDSTSLATQMLRLMTDAGLEEELRRKASSHLSHHRSAHVVGRYMEVVKQAFSR